MTTETQPSEAHNPHLKDLPYYKSHKVVQALKIASIEVVPDQAHQRLLKPANEKVPGILVDAIWVRMHKFEPGWYFVLYDNGYQSGSPAKEFEEGYTFTTKPLKDVKPPAVPTEHMQRLERLVMAARYGYAIVGMSFWKDGQYDAILVQVRENVDESSPVWKPMSTSIEDYSQDIRNEYESLASYLLTNKFHLKRLNEPKMESFTPATYVRHCAQKLDELQYLSPQDVELILQKTLQMPPWNSYNAMQFLMRDEHSGFDQFKHALQLNTEVFLKQRKEKDLERAATPA